MFQPSFLPRFNASIDYYNIEIEGLVGTVGALNTVNDCYFNTIASACALVASVLNLLTLLLTPLIWQGGRRVDSWSGVRKFAYTCTVLIYGALGLLLLRWGALFPWSA